MITKMTTIAVLLSVPLTANSQQDLSQQLAQLVAAEPDHFNEIIDQILVGNPGLEDITAAINTQIAISPSNERKKKLISGWSQWQATDQNGVTRPYQLYLPAKVADGTQSPTAVIIHMHGAVSKSDFGTGLGAAGAVGYAGFLWPKLADQENFIVACPAGKTECAWWTENGVFHVDAVIRDLQRTINIPAESIFGTGFSDGASGCYFRAMAAPDPFAGFIAMNGHPAVASSASGKQVYLPNMAMTSSIAAMTQLDSLYPSKSLFPHIRIALENDASVLTISYPNMNHQPSYFEQQTPAILEFIKKTKRTVAEKIRWYAADVATGKVQWLEIVEFVSAVKSEAVPEFNVMTTPSRVRIGIQYSRTEPNIIERVIAGSAAASAGILANDVLIQFDRKPLEGRRALRTLLRAKQYGDEFSCKVKRGDDELELAGQFPKFTAQPVYTRALPTGLVRCEIKTGENPAVLVRATNVKNLRVWLPNELANLEEILVTVNGSESKLPVARISKRELLEKFALQANSMPLRSSFVNIAVPSS